MTASFSFHRLGCVIRRDLAAVPSRFLSSFLSILGIFTVLWMLDHIGFEPTSLQSRFYTISFLTICTAVVAPSKIFGYYNHRLKGIDYVMLPASNTEKFISMILVGSILPIVSIFLCLLGLDAIFSVIPTKAFVHQSLLLDVASWNAYFKMLLFVLAVQSLFFFGNTFYKKNKFSTSFLLLVILSIIAGILLATFRLPILHMMGFDNMGDFFANLMNKDMDKLIMDVILPICCLFSIIVFWTLSFFSVKKQQY